MWAAVDIAPNVENVRQIQSYDPALGLSESRFLHEKQLTLNINMVRINAIGVVLSLLEQHLRMQDLSS